MKKLYFTLLSFFAGLTLVNAQVLLLQSNHAPVVGDSTKYYQVDSTLTTPGASGTGAVWTYTAAQYTRTNVLVSNTYTTPASIPSGSLYPSATVVQTNATLKNFYSSTSSNLSFWGGDFTAVGNTVNYNFTSAAIHALYPMAYNTTTNSAFTGSLQVPALSLNGTVSGGTSTVIADGTGTLQLPNRSFPNALRVSTFTGFNFNIPLAFISGSVKQQSWDYYSSLSNYPSTKIAPLLTIINMSITVTFTSTNTQTSTVVLVNKDYQYVGITENTSEIAELNLFPNPADNNFNLIFVNENAADVNIEISNTIGQVVQKETFTGTKGVSAQNVDVAKLEAGVYLVKINVGNKSSVKKLTVQ